MDVLSNMIKMIVYFFRQRGCSHREEMSVGKGIIGIPHKDGERAYGAGRGLNLGLSLDNTLCSLCPRQHSKCQLHVTL